MDFNAARATAWVCVLLIETCAGLYVCFSQLSLIPALVAAAAGLPLLLWLTLLLIGFYMKSQPTKPFNGSEQRASAERLGGEGKHIVTADGRLVEYIVYGSKREGAAVIIQMHGAGLTGGSMCSMNASLLEKLNMKGIAPSMPGAGYSDLQVERRIANYGRDDLAPILAAESVDKFMVDGLSLGSAHAMAIAWYFPGRCVGMGLMVPYLSTPMCKEFNMRCDADDIFLVRNNDPRKWRGAWNFAFWDIMLYLPFISPATRFFDQLFPKWAKERPWALPQFFEDGLRLAMRGSQGQGWDAMSYGVQSLWGFDPREIQTANVAVWYAKDDANCPPEHGKWLADWFESKEGVRTSIRAEDMGFGHMTYTPSTGLAYTTEEQSLPKTLLHMVAQSE